MAKIKNKSIYSADESYLRFLCDELDFLGRPYELDLKNGRVVQFALPPNRRKRRSKKERKRDARNKRAESAARRA